MKDLKIVTIDGKKCYEKGFKKTISISDYGISTIKGGQLEIEANLNIGFNIDSNADYTMLKGYLNNKLIPGTEDFAVDSYRDVPKGDNVYDIERLRSNPIALVDHENSAGKIAGNYIYLEENEQGLKFKLILRNIEDVYNPITKDAIQAWKSGFGKAFSIAGKWYYDMENYKPEEDIFWLVKAVLHEASLVAIGADSHATSIVPSASKQDDKGKGISDLTLAESVSKYLETEDDDYLKHIEKLKTKEVK